MSAKEKRCVTPEDFEFKFWNTPNCSVERIVWEAMQEIKSKVCDILAVKHPDMAQFVDLNVAIPPLSESETYYRKGIRKAAAE